MIRLSRPFFAALWWVLFLFPLVARGSGWSLLHSGGRAIPSSDQVTARLDGDALEVEIAPGGEGYPGIRLVPKDAVWDLSRFGHVAATVRNTGAEACRIHLRVDNAPGRGEKKNPWNTESRTVEAGEEATVRTLFGYQHGYGEGFPLDASEVTSVLLFTEKVTGDPVRFRVQAVDAMGVAGQTPDSLRRDEEKGIVPADGRLFGAGAEDRIDGTAGVTWEREDGGRLLRVRFPPGSSRRWVRIRPAEGRWDLRRANEVAVVVQNAGLDTVLPSVQVTSDRLRGTGWRTAVAPLGPTEQTEIVVPFAAELPWRGDPASAEEHESEEIPGGTRFASDRADSLLVALPDGSGESHLLIASAQARLGRWERPPWLGQRPPVPGLWTVTFDEEFEGGEVNPARWNVTGPNYWGRKELTHWSRRNVLVREGVAVIRLEKRRGRHNDAPDGHVSDYAGGYLDTYDKWRQRYGYFEARMKLPETPGLWPAFWMMPDRGRESGEMWRRQDTSRGGMEFDIMEHLTRWGPCRYHIALHWDGYGKNHRSLGTSQIYFRPDEEGFVTCGLLWTPGRAAYFCNGEEVGRVESDRISSVPGMMIFTLPIGGWDNAPLDDSRLPGDFVIDYVRVWQRADLASEADLLE